MIYKKKSRDRDCFKKKLTYFVGTPTQHLRQLIKVFSESNLLRASKYLCFFSDRLRIIS